jgi:hypothetical protein
VIKPDADGREIEFVSFSVFPWNPCQAELLSDFAYKFGLTGFKHCTLLPKWQLIFGWKCQRSQFYMTSNVRYQPNL